MLQVAPTDPIVVTEPYQLMKLLSTFFISLATDHLVDVCLFPLSPMLTINFYHAILTTVFKLYSIQFV